MQAHSIGEAFDVVFAAISEDEALAGEKMADRLRDEDLAAAGLRRNTGGEDDGGTEKIAVFFDWFASVEPDSNRDGLWKVRDRKWDVERPLECDSAIEGGGHRGERGHEAVAHGFDLGPTVLLERVARNALVLAENVAALRVAETVHHLGVAHDV